MKESTRNVFLFLFFVVCSMQIVFAQPTMQWVSRYDRPLGSSNAFVNQMALDKVGNCYVLGNIPIQSGFGGILTIKYNSNGDTVWTRTYNIGNGTTYSNTSITADSAGNVYVAGYVGYNLFGPYDIVVIKYNTNGNTEWINTYSGAGNISDSPGELKIGSDGMIYLTGQSGNATLLVKYKPNGDSVWVRLFSETGFSCGAAKIEFGDGNKIYIQGNRRNINNNLNYYHLLKYDTSGTLIWNRNFTINGTETARDLAVDRFGNSFISGDGFSGYTTVKYDSSGLQQWIRTYLDNNGSLAKCVRTDFNGNSYVTGASSLGGANYDILTIKYKQNGDSEWVRRYNGPGNFQDVPNDITIDDSSNIYITGQQTTQGNVIQFITLKYEDTGLLSWSQSFNKGVAHAILLDKQRNIFVSGVSDSNGTPQYATIKYSQPPIGGNSNSNSVISDFHLHQNYPNPFNPITTVNFQIPENSKITLRIYDILGRLVETLAENEFKSPGSYKVTWNAENFSSGIYFYRIEAENYTEIKKMILVK